jgi:hypothetical protein
MIWLLSEGRANGKLATYHFLCFSFFDKFTWKNLVNQAAVFCVKNALKLTSDHLRLEKIFRGLYPRTPPRGGERKKGEDRGGEGEGKGRRGRGRKGRGGEGLQPLQKCLSVLAPGRQKYRMAAFKIWVEVLLYLQLKITLEENSQGVTYVLSLV